MEAHLHVHSDHDMVEDHVASSNEKGGPGPGAEGQRADMAIAELDSVINSYNSASSGTKSSGNGEWQNFSYFSEKRRKFNSSPSCALRRNFCF